MSTSVVKMINQRDLSGTVVAADEASAVKHFLKEQVKNDIDHLNGIFVRVYAPLTCDTISENYVYLCGYGTAADKLTPSDICRKKYKEIWDIVPMDDEEGAWEKVKDTILSSTVSKRGLIAWFESCLSRRARFMERIEDIVSFIEDMSDTDSDDSLTIVE